MKLLLLLVAVVAPHWSSGFAHIIAEHCHGPLQAAVLLLLLVSTAAASSVGIRGGFGERRPGLEYDTEDPLFDLNVLITGVQRILCRPASFKLHDVRGV